MFAAVVGHCSGRATPSLRNAPPRQSMESLRRDHLSEPKRCSVQPGHLSDYQRDGPLHLSANWHTST